MKTNFSMATRIDNPEQTFAIAYPKGEIIITNFQDFKNALADLTANGKKSVLFNCKDLDFISSIALSKFFNLKKYYSRLEGEVVFCCVSNGVRETFETIGFYEYFKIFDDEETALLFLSEDKIYSLKINSNIENLFKVIAFSREVSKKVGLSSKETYRLSSAVYEVISNIVEHTFQLKNDGVIDVIYHVKRDKIIVDIFDNGKKYDPTEALSTDFRREIRDGDTRGMGLYLVKKLCNQIDYKYTGEQKNCFSFNMLRGALTDSSKDEKAKYHLS